MKFREHRGGLADSLETMVELPATREALLEHLRKMLEPWPTAPMPMTWNLEVDHYSGPDERIGWADTWIVSIYGYGPVGFTDEKPT